MNMTEEQWVADEADPDDEELEQTDPVVVSLLGFDPLEYVEGEE